MPSGLFALLDDVAAIAKLAAASVDDIGAAASKASIKAAGVVIDDTAVTPRYVTGLEPARELPIIWKIAKGSLFNKLVILLPAALLLSEFLPLLVTPLLMVGGAYLAFEATEKIIEAFGLAKASVDANADGEPDLACNTAELEKATVAGAVRTDLILSAEIMAIALATIETESFVTRAIVLAVVAVAITVGVYGVVALIVKMDDIGLHLARERKGAVAALGRGMVSAMPTILSSLATIGTAAMLWVGGGILFHGLEQLGLHWLEDVHHAVVDPVTATAGGLAGWLVEVGLFAITGLVVGLPIAGLVHLWAHRKT